MRYWFVLLLAGCTASNWTKQGATTADLERDYDDCRDIAKLDTATAAVAGVFGAVGIFVGTTYKDSKIRTCLQARGWAVPPTEATAAAPAAAPASAAGMTAAAAPAEPAALTAKPVKTSDPETPAARRLRDLKALLDQGLITKEEYEARRQAILAGL